MIRVAVVYPNTKESHFDISYYCKTHIPLVRKLVGPALKAVAVEPGIAGGTRGSAAPYLAIGQLQFDSVEAFQASLGPHGLEIMADIPNYTNTQPVIQISEVKL